MGLGSCFRPGDQRHLAFFRNRGGRDKLRFAMTRPTIAILLDYQDAGTFSKRPHYALRCAYFDAVWTAGGLPIAVPYLADAMDHYRRHADGFVLPGGFYPFPAAWYGDKTPAGEVLHRRFAFEADFCKSLLDADLPMLGVCAGMQILGGVLGGTFYRNIRIEPGTPIDHLNEQPAEHVAHSVTVEPNTLLHTITGREAFGVNTAHNEALRTVPNGAVLNATSEDGVIEGIEIPGARFVLGVQWHPEFFLEQGDPNRALFEALVHAAATS